MSWFGVSHTPKTVAMHTQELKEQRTNFITGKFKYVFDDQKIRVSKKLRVLRVSKKLRVKLQVTKIIKNLHVKLRDKLHVINT
jgi:hypothetical protein